MKIRSAAAVAAFAGIASFAGAADFDFDSLVHGEIVSTQFAPALTVSGTNASRPFDIVAAFDTTLTGTADPDLEGPPWAGGNLAAAGEVLGRALIIAENDGDANGDGILDDPDDEGRRPSGTITLTFDRDYSSFGFDFIDIEGTVSETSSLDFYDDGVLVETVTLMDIAGADASIAFGNNYANRVAAFAVSTYDEVVINVGGSSAWDNIVVPTPATAALGLAGLLVAGRRRR